jgi:hypothetical protein
MARNRPLQPANAFAKRSEVFRGSHVAILFFLMAWVKDGFALDITRKECSFLKKRTKKLLLLEAAAAQKGSLKLQKFFASFFKKEGLS